MRVTYWNPQLATEIVTKEAIVRLQKAGRVTLKLCRCGCGEGIIIKKHHKWVGVPDYIKGHYARINPPWKGKHLSPEAIEKKRIAMLGHRWKCKERSEEHRKRMSEATQKLWQDPEYRRFHEQMNIGRRHSEETKEKMRQNSIGRVNSHETRRRISESNKGRICNEYQRRRASETFRGKSFSEEHRKKIADAQRNNFKDPAFCKKMGIAWGMKPNKQEKLLFKLLDRLYPGEWKYTGDFSFTINGKCPDFVNCNGQKKVIELFGSYWHEGENPQDRVNMFSSFGFETLVIWEHELKDINVVTGKIMEFHGAR